jgi:hypothetical protein
VKNVRVEIIKSKHEHFKSQVSNVITSLEKARYTKIVWWFVKKTWSKPVVKGKSWLRTAADVNQLLFPRNFHRFFLNRPTPVATK